MAEPYYTTANALRTELGVDNTVLSDGDAAKLIESAEDLIDELVGNWPVDTTTGRKIVQAQIDAWQWSKLGRATLKLAAALYRDPDLARGQRYRSQSGPDFSVSGPVGGAIAHDVLTPLNQSGLRILTGRARPGTHTRLGDSFFRATRHDGT